MTLEHEHATVQVAAVLDSSDEALTWIVRQMDRLHLGQAAGVGLTVQSTARVGLDAEGLPCDVVAWQVALFGPYPAALPPVPEALP